MSEAEYDRSNNFDQKFQGSFFSSFQNDFLKQGHDGDEEIIKYDRVNSNRSLEKSIPQKIINFDSQDQTQISRSLQFNQDRMNNYDSQFESPQFQQQLEQFIQNQDQYRDLQPLKINKKVSDIDQFVHNRLDSQGSIKSIEARRAQKRFSYQSYIATPKSAKEKKSNYEKDVLKQSQKNLKMNESLTSLKKFSILSPHATQNNLISKKHAHEHFSFAQSKENKKDLCLASKNSQMQMYTQQQSCKIEKALKIIQQIKNTRFNQATRVQSIIDRFVKLLLIYSGKHQINLLQEHQFEQVSDLSSFYQEKVQTGLLNKIKSQFRILFSICSFNIPVIMPSQIFAIVWDIFLVLYTLPTLMIYSILTFCAQHQPDELAYIEVFKIMLFIFIIDVILNFNFAHFSQDAIVIDRKLIAKKYLKQNFFTDMTATIVLFSKIYFSQFPLFYNPGDSFVLYLINSLVFLKLKSIVQKTSRFDEIMQSKESQKHKLRLLKLIIQIILIAHSFAVGWNIMVIIENNNGIQDTWLSQKQIQNESWITKYIYSFYWCITTMTTVGFGDIVPTNQYEYLFMSMAMIFMSCNFAYTISNVGLILSEIEKNKRELNNCISNIQRYLNRKNVNISLKSRVRSYLVFLYKEQKDRNQEAEEKVFQKLSNKLRREIVQEINGKIVNSCGIFTKNFSSSTINKIIFAMKECVVSPNEIIFNEGDQDDMSIYFIQGGYVDIFQQNDSDKNKQSNQRVIKRLGQNQIFGELSFFSGLPRKAGAKSVNLTTLYKLAADDFLKIVKENQEDFERFNMIKEQIIVMQDLKQINIECYSCNSQGHMAAECPMIHLQFDKQFKNLRNNFSIIQQRQQNENRNVKIRYCPRLLIEINKKLQKRLKENSIYMESNIRLLFNTDTNEEQDSQSDITSDSQNEKITANEQNNALSSQLLILQHAEGINKAILQNTKTDRRKSQFLNLKQQSAQSDDNEKETHKLKSFKFQRISNPSFQSFQDINKANEQILFQDQIKNEKLLVKFQNTINEVIENNSDVSEKSIEKQIMNNQNKTDLLISNKKNINSRDSFKLDSEYMINSNLSQENAIHSPKVLTVSPTNQINQFQDFQDVCIDNDLNQYQSNSFIRKQKQRYATQPPQSYNQYSQYAFIAQKMENKNFNAYNNTDSQKNISEKKKSIKINADKSRQKILQVNASIFPQSTEKQEYKKRCSIDFSNRRQSKFLFNGQLQSFQHIENKVSNSNTTIKMEDSQMKNFNLNKMDDSQVNRFNTIKMEDSQQLMLPYQNQNQIDLKEILLLNQLGKRNNNNIQQLDKQTFSKYFYKFSFENMKIFKVFFPHNNYNKVIQSFRICQQLSKKQKKQKNINYKKQKINQKETSQLFHTQKGNTEFSNHQIDRTSYNDLNYKPSFISYGVALKKNFKLHPTNNLKNFF
ncbi:cation channel family protein (macronuclear) [Tetrahymena thermophila SB210]|uniref:Cation channel family protein n=1 Tax=Tetrahymena thermophila (strain SB210) TaxID=312017 RepID=I7LZM5_TETTS|nr:cation channel family protein [Tetrahymena thermophila SB210]EAR84285.2 cation channel family protein [Tetrahymena thermophila SB210]|eukprot:XP_001031948.2 cation channel family protein [Tetrahymena thermophila SB210]